MNDDTLILYYYRDGLSDEERAAVETALESDGSVRERYRVLQQSLDRLNAPPGGRVPARVVERWHRSIDRAAEGERDGSGFSGGAWHFPSFAWGALAAALVAAVAVGLHFGGIDAPVPSTVVRTDEVVIDDGFPDQAAAPASFSRGLQVHLRRTRHEVLHLTADGNADRAALILDIMRQNRLFEQAAQEQDADDVARVLRALEPVLLRLASEDLGAEDAAALKAKLAFELNVMLTKMGQRESDDGESV